jgi:hypothetical protein
VRLEPLALAVDQADQRDRALRRRCRNSGQRIEARLRLGVEQAQLGQQRQTPLLFLETRIGTASDRVRSVKRRKATRAVAGQ